MNNDEQDVYFDMDENMGSYYDFNLLDLLENTEDNIEKITSEGMDKHTVTSR